MMSVLYLSRKHESVDAYVRFHQSFRFLAVMKVALVQHDAVSHSKNRVSSC